MKIVVCGSLTHYKEMDEARKALKALGHETLLPLSAERLLTGESKLSVVDEFKKNTTALDDSAKIKNDAIIAHMKKIRESDAILVTNFEKNGIDNYIGGNTLMEMAFAVAFGKKIFLSNPIPEIGYKDEIIGCLPTIINNNFQVIK